MNRRETIQRLSLLLGGALSTQITAALMGQTPNAGGPSVEVDEERRQLIAELADVIIPDTDTPGAKAAGVEQFIIRVLRDCHVLEDQRTFHAGLDKLNADSRAAHGKGFVDLDAATRTALVRETLKTNRAFFFRMRELTVTGYFTSEIGATQALEYVPVPGRFEGDIPLQPGQKAWALR